MNLNHVFYVYSEIIYDKGIICQFFNSSSKLNIIAKRKLISRARKLNQSSNKIAYDHKTRLLPHSRFPYIEISTLGFVFDSYSIRIIISWRYVLLLSVDNSIPRKLNYDFIAFQQRKTDESLLQILRQIYRFTIERISVSFNLTRDLPSPFLGH